MNLQEVNLCFEALDQRERLIAMLALTAGMRPGEILALQWKPNATKQTMSTLAAFFCRLVTTQAYDGANL